MSKQNDFGEGFSQNVDLGPREEEIVSFAEKEMGFSPQEIVSRSTWWGSKRTGAFQCAGQYQGNEAILKVQGAKPSTSEIDALEALSAAAQPDAKVRSPFLYASRRWDDKQEFELLIVERITSPKLIHLPTSEDEVEQLYHIYGDYKLNLQPHPWIPQPDASPAEKLQEKIKGQLEAAEENYPDHPHRHDEDIRLIHDALAIAARRYQSIPVEFQHCHISTDDVFLPNGEDPRYVYTSNFVWGWAPVFNDALQARHHFPRLLIERGGKSTAEEVNMQTAWFDQELDRLPQALEEKTHMQAVRLELAISSLAIDNLMLDPTNPLAPYLMEISRRQIRELTEALAD